MSLALLFLTTENNVIKQFSIIRRMASDTQLLVGVALLEPSVRKVRVGKVGKYDGMTGWELGSMTEGQREYDEVWGV